MNKDCTYCNGKGYGHFPLNGMEAGDHVPCPKCNSAENKPAPSK